MKKGAKKTQKTPDLKTQIIGLEDISEDLRAVLLGLEAKEGRVIEKIAAPSPRGRDPQARFKLTEAGYVQVK